MADKNKAAREDAAKIVSSVRTSQIKKRVKKRTRRETSEQIMPEAVQMFNKAQDEVERIAGRKGSRTKSARPKKMRAPMIKQDKGIKF